MMCKFYVYKVHIWRYYIYIVYTHIPTRHRVGFLADNCIFGGCKRVYVDIILVY